MSHYRRVNVNGATYFFTVVTERRQRILTNDDVREALRAAIIKVRSTHPFEINAWVLLPDHLHCIWTLPEGDADFSTRWRLIKREVTVAIGAQYFRHDFQTERRSQKQQGTIWQHRFWEHLIRDDGDFAAHMDYLHFNPVKHGLVKTANEWPWSSFHRLVKDDVYPLSWGGEGLPTIILPHDEG
ncbi:MAG: transposase [Burkholderiales bacterium]|nr:transposase [Burkholderiales bacterium]